MAYPRREEIATDAPAQRRLYSRASRYRYIDDVAIIDTLDRYETRILTESQEFEVADLVVGIGGLGQVEDLQTTLPAILDAPLAFHEEFVSGVGMQARLLEWDRSYYWNDDATAALPLGEVGQQTLLHHEESACFTDALISTALGDRVDANRLETEGRYVFKEGYWWQWGSVYHPRPAEQFYLLDYEARVDGSKISYRYDEPYFLTLAEIEDDLGNLTLAEIDYHLIAPHRITDLNANVAEVLYDPLGVIVVSTAQGSVLDSSGSGQLYGDDLLSAYTVQLDPTFDAVLTESQRFLQTASQFFYYELDSWTRLGLPLRSVSLVREEFVYDGQGGGALTGAGFLH